MKKSILFLFAVCLVIGNPLDAQINRLLNKVTKSVTADKKPATSAQSENTSKEPEPKSACDNPELIVDLGGKLKLMYSEINISLSDDGSILLKDRTSSDYYIVKNGTPEGPIKEGDPRLAAFETVKENNSNSTPTWSHNEYITKTGEKYTINFGGKSYGPYAEIQQFKVTKSKEKFAAIVVQTVAYSQDRVKQMEAAMKNAKTDQEKMDLSMKFSQEMAQNMQKAGGAEGILPKLITNIPGAKLDLIQSRGNLNNSIKYDDILIPTYDKIIDLSGKELLTIKPEAGASEKLFLNSSNTKYAYYNYGTLTFGDGTSLPDLFNAHLIKSNGAVSIAYMYYSPKSNAIMQCKIPF
jgi:hypothetical protein